VRMPVRLDGAREDHLKSEGARIIENYLRSKCVDVQTRMIAIGRARIA